MTERTSRMRWLTAMVVIAAGGMWIADGASAQSRRVDSGSATVQGFAFHWETQLNPPTPPLADGSFFSTFDETAPNQVHRMLMDRVKRVYFGYTVQVEPQPGRTFKLAFFPLTLTAQLKQRLGDEAASWKALPSTKFPGPQTIRSGDVLELSLLANDNWGQRLTEFLTVQEVSRPEGFVRLDSTSREFSFAAGRPRDFTVTDGKLKAAMNTPESKAYHELWVKMIQDSGPKNWSTYTWYQVGTDLGAGASAMIFDADILGYFMNGGDNKEKGNIGYAPFAANPDAKAPTPNVWIWSLALSSYSNQKEAAWYFMQWASSVEHDVFGARKMDFVNPVRASVWKDEEFRNRIDKSYPGYLEQHDVSAPGAKEEPVDDALGQLDASSDKQLKDAGLGG